MFYTARDLADAQNLLKKFKLGEVLDWHDKPDIPITSMRPVTCEEIFGYGKCGPQKIYVEPRRLWEAKTISDSMVNGKTQDIIPLLCRLTAFIPVHIPIVLGMMTSTIFFGHLFWHGINQSFNLVTHLETRARPTYPVDNGMMALSFGLAAAGSTV